MLYEILDETLDRLAEFEMQNPNGIITKQRSYTSLKSQILFFKDYYLADPEEINTGIVYPPTTIRSGRKIA